VEPVWQRIADGTLQSISVGYRVHRYEQISDPATGQTVHRAVDWEPYEISVVPIRSIPPLPSGGRTPRAVRFPASNPP
jgi:phage head maturation protease